MGTLKNTQKSQEYIRKNYNLNLMMANWNIIYASEKKVVCSLNFDIGTDRRYFVFNFNNKGEIEKVGVGDMIDGTLHLKEIKEKWRKVDK